MLAVSVLLLVLDHGDFFLVESKTLVDEKLIHACVIVNYCHNKLDYN